jgi:chromosome segregation ATPase
MQQLEVEKKAVEAGRSEDSRKLQDELTTAKKRIEELDSLKEELQKPNSQAQALTDENARLHDKEIKHLQSYHQREKEESAKVFSNLEAHISQLEAEVGLLNNNLEELNSEARYFAEKKIELDATVKTLERSKTKRDRAIAKLRISIEN